MAVPTKQCIGCGRELHAHTLECPFCQKQQGVAAAPNDSTAQKIEGHQHHMDMMDAEHRGDTFEVIYKCTDEDCDFVVRERFKFEGVFDLNDKPVAKMEIAEFSGIRPENLTAQLQGRVVNAIISLYGGVLDDVLLYLDENDAREKFQELRAQFNGPFEDDREGYVSTGDDDIHWWNIEIH